MTTDERTEQTRRIIGKLADGYCGDESGTQAERIVLRHHALQRLVQPFGIVIPYSYRLGELIEAKRVEVRRAFPHVMSLVQASALLHQRQREQDDQGRLIAEPDD